MRRKEKEPEKTKVHEVDAAAKMTLSLNYGDVTASVQADEENYVARITGKLGRVEEWPFHQFVIRFMKSIEKASAFKDPV